MIEREIDGVTRRFVFGTYTIKILKEIAGVKSINEVLEKLVNKRKKQDAVLGDVFEDEDIADSVDHQDFIVKFLYACAKNACMLKGITVDFSEVNLYEWFDLLGTESAMLLIKELVEIYTEKNRPAPQAGQSKEAA